MTEADAKNLKPGDSLIVLDTLHSAVKPGMIGTFVELHRGGIVVHFTKVFRPFSLLAVSPYLADEPLTTWGKYEELDYVKPASTTTPAEDSVTPSL